MTGVQTCALPIWYKGDLKWKQDETQLRVEMPAEKISDVGIALKVELT